MQKDILIRHARQADYPTIYELIETAFKTAEHRDGTEQDFAVDLRAGTNYIPELELVAEIDSQLIGHIMLTKTYVVLPDGGRYDTPLLAPLSVLREYRNAGVGSALVRAELRIARTMGYRTVFLVGEPDYYRRFGFELSHLYGISHEFLPAEYVQTVELVPGALAGITGRIKCKITKRGTYGSRRYFRRTYNDGPEIRITFEENKMQSSQIRTGTCASFHCFSFDNQKYFETVR